MILGAGMFTAIYIIVRAAGKYFGAYFGASVTKSPESVKNSLDLPFCRIQEYRLCLLELQCLY